MHHLNIFFGKPQYEGSHTILNQAIGQLYFENSRKEINYVSELTGLTFPNGTEPVGYYFLGSGIDRKMELPKAEYLECTVGLEDGKTYVYVTWFEI